MSQRTRLLRQAAVVLGIAMAFVLPLRLRGAGEALTRGVAWAQDAGPAGALAYGVAYVLATILGVPGLLLTLGAGFVYGPFWGTLLISPASVAGASAAFLLARTLLRRSLVRRFGEDPRFRAVDRAVAEGGFRIVLLLRLSPLIPFNLLNYALGLTRVRPWHYVGASFLGMLPATILYVWLGSLLTSAADLMTGTPEAGRAGRLALLATGIVATVVVAVMIGRAARRALERELREPTGPAPP